VHLTTRAGPLADGGRLPAVVARLFDRTAAALPILHTLGANAAAFTAASLLYQASRLGLSLIAARVLGPELFGVWVLVVLVLQYSNFLSLGTTNGANREIPYLKGSGQTDRAAHAEDVALSTSLISGAVAAGLVLALAPWLVPPHIGNQAAVVVLLAIAVFLQQLFLLQQVLFLANFRLRSASIQLTVLAVTIMGVGLPCLLTMGLVGLMFSQIVTSAMALIVAQRLLDRRPWPSFDRAVMVRLAVVGLPIMTAGLLFGVLTTLDRWLVLSMIGLTAVGYYGIVGVVMSGLLLVPNVLGQQFYPRIAFAHGQGASGPALLRIAKEQSLIAGSVVAGIAVFVAVAAIVGIPWLLHDYTEAIAPLLVSLAGLVVFGFGSGYGNLLNAVRAHRLYLSIQAIAVVTNFGLAVTLVSLGFGLVGVALGVSTSMAFYSLMLRVAAGIATRGIVISAGPAGAPEALAPLENLE
jgi:O-antigen/teichoic acid export membrane protein